MRKRFSALFFVIFFVFSGAAFGASEPASDCAAAFRVTTNSVEILAKAKSKLSEKDFIAFREWYLAHFFFDRADLLESHLTFPQRSAPSLYEKNGEDPFLAYMVVRESFFQSPILNDENLSDVTKLVETLKKMNRSLLWAYSSDEIRQSYGRSATQTSEATPLVDLIGFRTEAVGFYIHPTQHRRPHPQGGESYYPYMEKERARELPTPRTYEDLMRVNPLLSKEKDFMEYADIRRWRHVEKQLPFQLRDKLRKAESTGWSKISDNKRSELVSHYVDWLVQRELMFLVADIERLMRGDLQQTILPAHTPVLMRALADFYYNFISIHPFPNGNARVARLFIESILHQFGLPSPIWVVTGEDVLRSREEVYWMLTESVALSQSFHQQLASLDTFDIETLNKKMISFLLPSVLSGIGTWWSPRVDYFAEFQDFQRARKAGPSQRALVREYVKWLSDVRRDHDLNMTNFTFVPASFIDTFGSLPKSENDFRAKREKYYTDETIARGSMMQGAASVANALKYFTQVTSGTVGVALEPKVPAIQEAFRRFNQGLLQPRDFFKFYRAHVEAKSYGEAAWVKRGKGYENSIFASWSKAFEIAVGFSQTVDLLQPGSVGVGVLVIAKQPHAGAWSASQVYSIFNQKYEFNGEAEISVVGGVEPIAIEGVHMFEYDLKKSTTEYQREIHARRVDWNKVEVTIAEYKKGEVYAKPTKAVYTMK